MKKRILLSLLIFVAFFFGITFAYAEEENIIEEEDKQQEVVEVPSEDSTPPVSLTDTIVDDVLNDVNNQDDNDDLQNIENQNNLGDGNQNNLGDGNQNNLGDGNQNNLGDGNQNNLGDENQNNLGDGNLNTNGVVLTEPARGEDGDEEEPTTSAPVTYNYDYTIVSGEGSEVTLSSILEGLGVEVNPEDMESGQVVSSNPDVVSVTPSGSDYLVSSSSVFTTQETITITLSDRKIVLRITDSTMPNHGKEIIDNEDGTYILTLDVTGDSIPEIDTASPVNVVIVYDVSQSMTNYVSGNSGPRRSDAAENVVHDFLITLAGYQNEDKSNIQVSVVRFSVRADQLSGWTNNINTNSNGVANLFGDGGRYGDAKLSYTNMGNSNMGTNWEHPLQLAQRLVQTKPLNGPTFVIMITDGAPTKSGTSDSMGENPSQPWYELREHYNNATDEARAIEVIGENTPTNIADDATLFGIYASFGGNEADLLDDLLYYANNGSHRAVGGSNIMSNPRPSHDYGEPEAADNYYSAAETSALEFAISKILGQVIQAMGVSSVTISDGTTSSVTASTGTVHLLDIDENSYSYWMSMEVTPSESQADTYTNNTTGNLITFTKDGDNYKGTWTDKNGSHEIVGQIKEVQVNESTTKTIFEMEWLDANNGLHAQAPTPAQLIHGADGNDSVEWNLSNVGVLLNGVTYTVKFRVWPSQTTLDLIADLKNNPGLYDTLDENIKRYLVGDSETGYTLLTNTTASLTFTDTREENPQPTTATYSNPDPVNTMATESLAISKVWDNQLDEREHAPIEIEVLRDGASFGGENGTKISLSSTNNWKSSIYIAIGIMLVDEYNNVTVLASGHDYSFAELGSDAYNWELKAGTVRPMLVNGILTLLYNNGNEVPDGTEGVDWYKINTGTEEEPSYTYYIKGEEGQNASLTATNERRSYLDVNKDVIYDEGAQEFSDTFDFLIVVDDPKGDDIWFSVKETSAEDARFITEEEDELVVIGNNIVREVKTLTSNANIAKDSISITDKGDFKILTYTYCKLDENNQEKCETFNMILIGEAYKNYTYTETEDSDEVKVLDAGNPNITDIVLHDDNTITYKYKGTEYTVYYTGNMTDEYYKYYSGYYYLPNNTPFTVSMKEGWNLRIINLPKETTYSITETNIDSKYDFVEVNNVPEDYTPESVTTEANNDGRVTSATVTGVIEKTNVAYAYTFVNKNVQTEIVVTKVWDDEINDDRRPEDIVLHLYNGTEEVDQPESYVVDQEGNWVYTYTNLPIYNDDGSKITYTLGYTKDGQKVAGEDTVVGYLAPVITGDMTSGFVVTNTVDVRSITVEKEWDGNYTQDNVEIPESIQVQLYAGEEAVGRPVTITDNNGEWSYTWDGLPVNDDDGNPINYWVEEIETELIKHDEEDGTFHSVVDGFTITNTYITQKRDITVTKEWDGDYEQDGVEIPDSIEVTLYAGDTPVGDPVNITAEDGWSYTWYGLEVNDENGDPINYRVEETETDLIKLDEVDGTFHSVVDGFTITNTYINKVRKITVNKVWDDRDDYEGLRPDSVTILLLVNGDVVGEATLDEESGWEYTFKVDYYEDGTPIEYDIDEEKVDGYDTEITGSVEEGFTVTNTHSGTGGDDPEPENPKTADNIYTYVIMMIISLIGLLTVSYSYCKNN